MTRGQFVAELLELWEESAKKLWAEGLMVATEEVRTAIRVLERTYLGTELGVEGVVAECIRPDAAIFGSPASDSSYSEEND